MKCENLLFDSFNNVKVLDFGFCWEFQFGDVSKIFCGSVVYVVLEILQGIFYYGFLYDIWSMGVILYIMVSELI